jgi:hypothetical protein
MNDVLATSSVFSEDHFIILAREIAMDIQPLETILKRHGISADEWPRVQASPRFQNYLTDALLTWTSALNAPERIKVKSLTVIEDWLLTAYRELQENDGSLRDKTELAKLIARLAGVGEKAASDLPVGEKISITINMGTETIRHEKVVDVQLENGNGEER